MIHTVMQPRFAMTAAMAFFSIALTMNIAGVRLSSLHASDLKPSSVKKSFWAANGRVVRYYDNLRVVYELESRVHEMQRDNDTEPVPQRGVMSSPQNDAISRRGRLLPVLPRSSAPRLPRGTPAAPFAKQRLPRLDLYRSTGTWKTRPHRRRFKKECRHEHSGSQRTAVHRIRSLGHL